MAVHWKPAGYPNVIPYLASTDPEALIALLETVFAGKLVDASRMEDGSIRHAEVTIGDSMVMLGQAMGEVSPVMLYVYVEDLPACWSRALAAGGEALQEPTKQFYGDLVAGFKGPDGHQWWLATHVEDVGPEEMERRWAEERAKRG